MPQLRIEMTEKFSRGRLPSPPEVIDHLAQWLQFLRQFRDDVIGKQWLHFSFLLRVLSEGKPQGNEQSCRGKKENMLPQRRRIGRKFHSVARCASSCETHSAGSSSAGRESSSSCAPNCCL